MTVWVKTNEGATGLWHCGKLLAMIQMGPPHAEAKITVESGIMRLWSSGNGIRVILLRICEKL